MLYSLFIREKYHSFYMQHMSLKKSKKKHTATKHLYFFVLFLLINLTLSGNSGGDTLSSYFISGVRFHYGFIFAHTKEVQNVAHSNPIGFQADFSWFLINDKAYNYFNCYPRWGLSLYYWDFCNPEILGKGFNLIFFAEPFFNAHEKLCFSIRPGIGLVYLSNPYNEITNPENSCYSTHFSYVLLLSGTLNYKLSDNLLLNITANYNHISNGGVKMPNKGLNYPSFSLGLDYSFDPLMFPERKYTSYIYREKGIRKTIGIFIGFKGITENDNLYFVKGIYGNFGKQIERSSVLTGGIELIADGGEKNKSKYYSSMHTNAQYMGSILAGYEHLIGRFTLSFDLGFYFYNSDRLSDIVYQRYGLKYYISKKYFTGLNLKAHRHIADFFDIRLGITF